MCLISILIKESEQGSRKTIKSFHSNKSVSQEPVTVTAQLICTSCTKSTIEILEKGEKYVQS